MRGSIVKRGSTWSIVYRAIDPETGRPKQTWRGGFRTKKDAERALHEIVGQIDSGTYTKPVRQTVHQYLRDDWLPFIAEQVAAGNLRPTTADQYRWATVHLLDPEHGIGGVRLQALTPERLDKLYGHLLTNGRRHGNATTGLSRTTVAHVHVAIGRALHDAVQWRKLTTNVATLAHPPKPNKGEAEIWSPEQLRTFLAHVADDRMFAMWLLFATTGPRRGEVAGLLWRHVRLDDAEVDIRSTHVVVKHKVIVSEPKTDKGRRTISLDPTSVAALRAHHRCQLEERMAWGPAWQDSGMVFTREDGSALEPDWITRRFQRLAADAGLPRLKGPHGLRHSYASAALESGQDIRVVQELLGHANVAVTQMIYQHVADRLKKQAANQTAAFILGDQAK